MIIFSTVSRQTDGLNHINPKGNWKLEFDLRQH